MREYGFSAKLSDFFSETLLFLIQIVFRSSRVSNGLKKEYRSRRYRIVIACTGDPDIYLPFFTQTAEEPHHRLDLRPNEQCIDRRIQQQDSMAHTPAIWLSRCILSQIADLSTTLDSTSEGVLIYGPKRRRDKKWWQGPGSNR